MSDVIEFIQSNISAFDLIVFLIVVYSMAQVLQKDLREAYYHFRNGCLL